MDYDIKRIRERGFLNYFNEVENADLSENFWQTQLPQRLESASISSPYLNVFFAAQIFFGDNALFCNGTKVGDLIDVVGDVHHIFPRKYLIKNNISERNKYNQIANFTYLDPQINKAVGDDAPGVYFKNALAAAEEGKSLFGDITSKDELIKNMELNGIPAEAAEWDYTYYESFLAARRQNMAKKIREYYNKL